MRRTLALALLVALPSLPAQTPRLVKDINPGGASSRPEQITSYFGLIVFVAQTANAGWELWKSDGSAVGTSMLQDISTSATEKPRILGLAGPYLLFTHMHPQLGRELYRTDGTTSGTVLVKDIWRGAGSGAIGASATSAAFGNRLVFQAKDPTNGYELWISDGTAQGTHLIADSMPGDAGLQAQDITVSGDRFFFTGHEPAFGRELWVSDGTAAGTRRVKDINKGKSDSNPGSMTPFRGGILFYAWDLVWGSELRFSDGTESGTRIVKDITTGSGSSSPRYLTRLGEKVVFSASNGVAGSELWITDGTAAGTTVVRDIEPNASSSGPHYLQRIGSQVLFVATTAKYGSELWVSDGTFQGTRLVKDLVPGTNGLRFQNTYIATGSRHGIYWTHLGVIRTDGTAAGTVTMPKPTATSSRPYALNNGRLFFDAYDATNGSELWVLEPQLASTETIGHGCGVGAPPTLEATDAALGKSLTVTTRSVHKNTPGVGIFGFPAFRPTPFGTTCTLYAILAASVYVPFRTDATGKHVQTLPVPSNSALIGARVVTQSAVTNTSFPPMGLELSNGAFLFVGR